MVHLRSPEAKGTHSTLSARVSRKVQLIDDCYITTSWFVWEMEV